MQPPKRGQNAICLSGDWSSIQTVGWNLLENGYQPVYNYFGGRNATLLFVHSKGGGWQDSEYLYKLSLRMHLSASYADMPKDGTPLTLSAITSVRYHDQSVRVIEPSDIALPRHHKPLLATQRPLVRWSVLVDTRNNDLARICEVEGVVCHRFALKNAYVIYVHTDNNRNMKMRSLGFLLRSAQGLPNEHVESLAQEEAVAIDS